MRWYVVGGSTLLSLATLWLVLNVASVLPVRQVFLVGNQGEMPVGRLDAALRVVDNVHFFSDLSLLERKLSQEPWLDRVRIERQYPWRWWLYYQVRTPILRWQHDAAMLDAKGEMMLVAVPESLSNLPVVEASADRARLVFALWRQLEGVWQQRLLRIQQDELGEWVLFFQQGLQVRLGNQALVDRLARFLQVARHWKVHTHEYAQYFDMRYASAFSHRRG